MGDLLRFDLVICTYNNARGLAQVLDAIAAQEATADLDCRVLVVDNNCTDDTAKVVADRRKPGFPMPLESVLEATQGLTPARVCGVRNTTGDWIAFIDDDCVLDVDWLAQASAFARAHPQCGGFGGRVILHWESGPPPAWFRAYGWAFAETDAGDCAFVRGWLPGAGMVLRRGALLESGWLDQPLLHDRIGTKLVSGGDVEMGLRVAQRHEVWYHPGCRLRHQIPARRMQAEYLERLISGLGGSAHQVDMLGWQGSLAGWHAHALRAGLSHCGQALRQIARDLRRRRHPHPRIALAFTLGWARAMIGSLAMESRQRRQLLGALGRDAGGEGTRASTTTTTSR